MWKKIISDLISCGMSEAQIAAIVGYAQPTIHRLKTGALKEPSYTRGAELVALHRRVYRKRKAVA